MIIIFALSIWIAVIYLAAPSIRKYSMLFYASISTIAAMTLIFPSYNVSESVNDGYAALSLWIIVMLVGIQNPMKKLSKKIRLVRTELSIAAFILTIAHFISDFVISFELPISTGLVSLLIMIPLFVTSFSIVRRRIDGKRWKKLHRWSYAAYILMLLHVALVTDNSGHLAVYSLVLFVYVFFKFKSSRLLLKTAKFLLLAFILFNFGKLMLAQPVASSARIPDENPQDISSSENIYEDGTYAGIADGYGPDLTVEVSINNNSITNISIINHNERGESFFMPAFENIPKRIIENQSASVDAVSGSTYTSCGIMNAVNDALSQALVSGELEKPAAGEVHTGRHRNKRNDSSES